MIKRDTISSMMNGAPKVVIDIFDKMSMTQKIAMGVFATHFACYGLPSEIVDPVKSKINRVEYYVRFLDETLKRVTTLDGFDELDNIDFGTWENLALSMANNKTLAIALENKINLITQILFNFLVLMCEYSKYMATIQDAADARQAYFHTLLKHPFIRNARIMIDSIITFSEKDVESLISRGVNRIVFDHVRYVFVDMVAKGVCRKGADNLVDPLQVLELLTVPISTTPVPLIGCNYTKRAINLIVNRLHDQANDGKQINVPQDILDSTKPLTGKRYRKYLPSILYTQRLELMTEVIRSSLTIYFWQATIPSTILANLALSDSFNIVDYLFKRTDSMVGRVFIHNVVPSITACALIGSSKSLKATMAIIWVPILSWGVKSLVEYSVSRSYAKSLADLYDIDRQRMPPQSQ
ncbi:hypothetical protein DFA_05649 [Cavenderia fasciculata]|uniref:Uncharacterized protein n=1 Tax=Cavenderia fasciculata TaxID=261658 RepID=F4PLW2_CACFS|nr:uncharacterized protein DFA_05649 [Cavenderia fasciculata]EGG23516.1 hypothetical protein DFA_05649 [Cavenderia fasciculata]|eukprot:XP_004361367.1 hypothetical protein DFA_05649 [Cavenderia fasciculata]